MSLILDALNRSESDRAAPESVPGLQTVHDSEAPPVPLWRRLLWPALVLVLAVIAIVPWLMDRPASQAPQASQPSLAAVETKPAATAPREITPSRAIQPAAAVKPSAQVDADVAALYSNPPATPVAVESTPAVPVAVEPAAVELEDAAGEVPEPTSVATEPAEQGIDIDALTRAAQAEMAARQQPAPFVEHEAPFVDELRQSQKDQIPTIFYSAHNWASNPAERSVILNGEARRAGQQIKPGLRLVEILEDSIVLDFRGTEFRLRSLNSWVNL